MKRSGRIVGLTLLIVMLATMFSFGAETFRITNTEPKNGAENTTKDNMCVKVFFNKPVGNEQSKAANKDAFRITNESGKEFPTRIIYSSKNSKYALIIIDTTKVAQTGKGAIQDNTKYTCTISGDFQANDGETLGKDTKITFKTMNQKVYTIGYTVMMFLMFGGMMVFSTTQMKKKDEEKKDEELIHEKTFNPYKEAKKTGKSVEQVLKEHDAELEKARKKEAKKNRRRGISPEDTEDRRHGNAYRVSRPRPIREAGSTFRTGRKAQYEAKAAEEAAKRAELKATNYGKNPKAKKK